VIADGLSSAECGTHAAPSISGRFPRISSGIEVAEATVPTPEGVLTMRMSVVTAAICAALSACGTANAQVRGGNFEGFGGTTFGTTTTAPTFGASVAFPLGDYVQIVGEAGRLSDIKAELLDDLLYIAPVDITMSAWYAEGGARFLGSRHSSVRPYVEGTAGIARLRPGISADGFLGALANTGLSFLDRREPMVGAGAGVLFQTGPVAFDVGYRYKRILANDGLSSAFALGNNGFDVNQLRVGVGVRF
jgi:Outer membrane protein beta-barrel domain